MSDLYLARTNQKLHFARIHLDALERAHQSTGWSQHVEIESYHESVLFHLASAYGAFLREIAEKYRFSPVSVNSIADLEVQFEASGQESPERAELQRLECDETSWLHSMLLSYHACWLASDERRTEPHKTSVSEIHVMQINPDHAEDADILAEYRRWFREFQQLVERLRFAMQEW